MTMPQTHAKPLAPGRRERRRAETREKLYQAAMQLFAERGFFETTTEDITEAADLGQGTFFNYFPTKQHVLTVLSEKQLERVMAARQEAEGGNACMHDVLHRLMHRIAEEPGRSQALTRTLMTALISSDSVRELVRNTMGCGREIMAGIVALGQKRKEIRSDRKPSQVALAFQRNVFGTLLLWAMQPQGDLHAWVEDTFRDFWAAIGDSRHARTNGREEETGHREKRRGELRSRPPKQTRAAEGKRASLGSNKALRNADTVVLREEL
jgi:AcrR family transcriptional regulator